MRENVGVDAKIKFDAVGVGLKKLPLFLLLDLCGTIFATSPKLMEICGVCLSAPMLPQSTPIICCVEIGGAVGATGISWARS